MTQIAQFFGTRPQPFTLEGLPHWRIDCYVQNHRMSPLPEDLAVDLTEALMLRGVCDEPLLVSWHLSTEIGNLAFGDVWDDD